MENKDRREAVRYRLDEPVRVSINEGQECFDCQLKDIGFKGAQLIVSHRIDKDTYKTLRIRLSQECVVNVECWVAWHRIIDGYSLCGLYFSKISNEAKEKIYQFIRHYCAGQIQKRWWNGIKEITDKGGENMMKGDFVDRRIFERFPARFNLRYLDLFANREGTGWTNDISAKGLGVTLNYQVAKGAPVEIWVDIPGRPEPHYLRGEIVWCEKTDEQNCRAGVNLERANLMSMSTLLAAR
ncbi:MAG: PilZ domain-containing protein [Candidatus Omnitrophica bacterium]|nr:PilZ domain-containing protein [Candidatus Omnitrophota bacterium]